MKPFSTSSIFVLSALLAATPHALAQEEAGGLFGLLLGSEPAEPSAAAASDAAPEPEEAAPDMRGEPGAPIVPGPGTVAEEPAVMPEEPPLASEPPVEEEAPAFGEERPLATEEPAAPAIREDASAGGDPSEPAPSATDELVAPEIEPAAPAAAGAEPFEGIVSPEVEAVPGIERGRTEDAAEDRAVSAAPVAEPLAPPLAEGASVEPDPRATLEEDVPAGEAVASRSEPRPLAPGDVALPETEIQGEIEKPDIFFLLPKARDQSDDQVIRARIRREITRPLVKEWLEEMMLLK